MIQSWKNTTRITLSLSWANDSHIGIYSIFAPAFGFMIYVKFWKRGVYDYTSLILS